MNQCIRFITSPDDCKIKQCHSLSNVVLKYDFLLLLLLLFIYFKTFAGFADFAACLISTFHRKEIFDDSRVLNKGHFGYCFILAWLCVPLLLVSGVLYIHLRKKQ